MCRPADAYRVRNDDNNDNNNNNLIVRTVAARREFSPPGQEGRPLRTPIPRRHDIHPTRDPMSSAR
jgi:hypothetical protein